MMGMHLAEIKVSHYERILNYYMHVVVPQIKPGCYTETVLYTAEFGSGDSTLLTGNQAVITSSLPVT